ncbi:MAG: helix-turn-helix transcriptional regulator [Desulfocapsa sp.]|nr:helix-turn-helix transcriptional regulator [Desulfocapsa sp.]
MSKIIQTLKSARQKKGLTQAELGKKLGLPQSHISKIEQELTNPQLSTLRDMARILDLELTLVPRSMLPAVRSLLAGEDTDTPRWQPDEED